MKQPPPPRQVPMAWLTKLDIQTATAAVERRYTDRQEIILSFDILEPGTILRADENISQLAP